MLSGEWARRRRRRGQAEVAAPVELTVSRNAAVSPSSCSHRDPAWQQAPRHAELLGQRVPDGHRIDELCLVAPGRVARTSASVMRRRSSPPTLNATGRSGRPRSGRSQPTPRGHLRYHHGERRSAAVVAPEVDLETGGDVPEADSFGPPSTRSSTRKPIVSITNWTSSVSRPSFTLRAPRPTPRAGGAARDRGRRSR
jgi:hypothetical protein